MCNGLAVRTVAINACWVSLSHIDKRAKFLEWKDIAEKLFKGHGLGLSRFDTWFSGHNSAY